MKILIIEDSPIDSVIIMRILAPQKHEIRVAKSLEEATEKLENAKQNNESFEFVLADLFLPGSDPQDVVAYLSKLPIPYTILTGNTDPKLAHKLGEEEIPMILKEPNKYNMEVLLNYSLGLAETKKERNEFLNRVGSLKIFEKIPDELDPSIPGGVK